MSSDIEAVPSTELRLTAAAKLSAVIEAELKRGNTFIKREKLLRHVELIALIGGITREAAERKLMLDRPIVPLRTLKNNISSVVTQLKRNG